MPASKLERTRCQREGHLIDDLEFGALVETVLNATGIREERDKIITNALLGAGVVPKSYVDLRP